MKKELFINYVLKKTTNQQHHTTTTIQHPKPHLKPLRANNN